MLEKIIELTNEYIESMPKKERKKYGQFFTSMETARFMSGLYNFDEKTGKVSVLDAGAGSGILSCAFIERVETIDSIQEIELTCYENDENVLPLLKRNLEYCKEETKKKLTVNIVEDNYILSQYLDFNHMLGGNAEPKKYDFVIGNPPYMKIPKDAPEATAMPEVCYGAPNLYFIFASMGLFNLCENGEMVYIIPRSWTSGAYFKRFREYFLTEGKLEHIHLFVSRNKVFDKESVLQETIIIKVRKTSEKPETVTITSSKSNSDFGELTSLTVPYDLVVAGSDYYVYLVTDENEVEVLKKYYEHIRFGISGKKKKIPVLELKDMLRWKGKQLLQQVRENEWIELSSKEGFFNGYYNNDGNAVDGILGDGKLRFGLTAQTFSIMSGAATDEQVQKTIHAVNNYLPDKNTGGIRLTLPLGDNTWNFGRGFALIYGEKENGGMFSHMTTMYAYALYSRGYVREGYQIIKSIYELSTNTQIAQIYPGVPEYISSRGRGMYSYVTGAGSWTIFLMLTQVYGVRGKLGDLLIEPKLVKEQYDSGEVLTVDTLFAEKEVCVSFYNRKYLDYGEYQLGELSINGEVWKNQINSTSVVLHQAELEEKLIAGRKNQICIELVERKG